MSITSANAVLTLSISSLFPNPVQLQQFAVDDIYSVDAMESAETMMGVDGYLTGGFVYVPVKQGITLMADSPSNDIFDTWWEGQQQIQDLYFATQTLLLPSLGKKWTLSRGILTSYPPIPDGKKLLQPRKYSITWQRPQRSQS